MATQNDLSRDHQTHTLRIIEGGNAQLCLLSLSSLTILECQVPTVMFFVGKEGETPIPLSLIITAYELIDPPYRVSMKAVFETDRHMVYLGGYKRKREFIITNYNTNSRKGWVQIPTHYLAGILELLERA